MGEIVFTQLTNAFTSGSMPHAAFAGAASNAILYQVASFALVIALVPFLKGRSPAGLQGGAPVAAPAIVEA